MLITLLNCDCMDFMRDLPDKAFDLAIVDPMYGESDAINPKSSENVYLAKRGDYKHIDNKAPDYLFFDELKRVSKHQIIWGGNYFGLSGGVIVWDKNGTAFGDGEIAICSTHKSVRIFRYTWNGMLQQNMLNKETRIHPTQKPVALYRYILKNYAKEGDKILDTHGGSLSHAIAAYDLGFDLTIMEIDKDYYEAGKARYEAHVAKYAPASEIPMTKNGELKLF